MAIRQTGSRYHPISRNVFSASMAKAGCDTIPKRSLEYAHERVVTRAFAVAA